jgi:hypothetical protein
MHDIQFYLSSSIHWLEEEYDTIRSFVLELEEKLQDDINISINEMDFDEETGLPKQEQIEVAVKTSSVAFFVIGKTMGELTDIEFQVARDLFLSNNNPRIVVLFRDFQNINTLDPSVTKFEQYLREELELYYETYSHLEQLKLRLIFELVINSKDLELTLSNGIFRINDEIVDDQSNSIFYKNHNQLQTLRQKRQDLLDNPTTDSQKELEQINKEISNIDDLILNTYKNVFVSFGNQRGSQLLKEALYYVNMGDLDKASDILNNEDVMREVSQAAEQYEMHLDVARDTFESKFEVIISAINIKLQSTGSKRYEEADELYRFGIELEAKFGLELKLHLGYIRFLLQRRRTKDAFDVVLDAQDILSNRFPRFEYYRLWFLALESDISVLHLDYDGVKSLYRKYKRRVQVSGKMDNNYYVAHAVILSNVLIAFHHTQEKQQATAIMDELQDTLEQIKHPNIADKIVLSNLYSTISQYYFDNQMIEKCYDISMTGLEYSLECDEIGKGDKATLLNLAINAKFTSAMSSKFGDMEDIDEVLQSYREILMQQFYEDHYLHVRYAYSELFDALLKVDYEQIVDRYLYGSILVKTILSKNEELYRPLLLQYHNVILKTYWLVNSELLVYEDIIKDYEDNLQHLIEYNYNSYYPFMSHLLYFKSEQYYVSEDFDTCYTLATQAFDIMQQYKHRMYPIYSNMEINILINLISISLSKEDLDQAKRYIVAFQEAIKNISDVTYLVMGIKDTCVLLNANHFKQEAYQIASDTLVSLHKSRDGKITTFGPISQLSKIVAEYHYEQKQIEPAIGVLEDAILVIYDVLHAFFTTTHELGEYEQYKLHFENDTLTEYITETYEYETTEELEEFIQNIIEGMDYIKEELEIAQSFISANESSRDEQLKLVLNYYSMGDEEGFLHTVNDVSSSVEFLYKLYKENKQFKKAEYARKFIIQYHLERSEINIYSLPNVIYYLIDQQRYVIHLRRYQEADELYRILLDGLICDKDDFEAKNFVNNLNFLYRKQGELFFLNKQYHEASNLLTFAGYKYAIQTTKYAVDTYNYILRTLKTILRMVEFSEEASTTLQQNIAEIEALRYNAYSHPNVFLTNNVASSSILSTVKDSITTCNTVFQTKELPITAMFTVKDDHTSLEQSIKQADLIFHSLSYEGNDTETMEFNHANTYNKTVIVFILPNNLEIEELEKRKQELLSLTSNIQFIDIDSKDEVALTVTEVIAKNFSPLPVERDGDTLKIDTLTLRLRPNRSVLPKRTTTIVNPTNSKPRFAKRVQPEDPCPCGSGKQYQQCHGKPKQ